MVTRVKGGTAPNAAEIDMADGTTVQEAMPVIGNGPELVPDGAVLNTRLGTAGNLGSAATADRSTSVSSTSLSTVPTSSALKETYDKAVQVETTRLGWNQTWQDVTASRSFGVNYTNSTGRPIMVTYQVKNTGDATLVQDGKRISDAVNDGDLNRMMLIGIITPGGVYSVSSFGGNPATGGRWMELR
jgi:hypothetical protein